MTSNIIAKANGKDRVIDFRDQLSRALPENYATMHQGGGKNKDGKKTFPSVIKMVICDFSKGTGDKSVTVDVNLEPSVLYEWYEVCKANLGSYAVPTRTAVPKTNGVKGKDFVENEVSDIVNGAKMTGSMARSFYALVTGLYKHIGGVIQNKIARGTNDEAISLGATLKKSLKSMDEAQMNIKTDLNLFRGINYTYTQDKVNVYAKGQDGYAPVSQLMVTHQCIRSNDGDVSNYPWTFKITNGEAVLNEKATGATTFRSDTMRNKTEAYIMVSDRDMFRMMTRVTHFIDTWENAMCIPLIIEGEKQREAEFQDRRNNYNNQF